MAIGGAWSANQFIYKPALGASGALEKNTFDSGMDRIDARLGKEIWVGDPNYGSTLQEALTAIGSTAGTLRVPAGTHPISANLAIPINVTLRVERGGILALATGVTLTINGGFEAGLYQVFAWTGTGKVVFGAGAAKEFYPQWWGAKGDGSQDDVTYIQAAINSLTNGGTVYFTRGNYQVSGAGLTIPYSNITLKGEGAKQSKIYTPSPSAAVPHLIRAQELNNIHVVDLYFYGSATSRSWSYGFGLSFEKCFYSSVRYCTFEKFAGTAIAISRLGSDAEAWSGHCLIEGNIVKDCYSEGISGIDMRYERIINNHVENTGTDSDNSAIGLEGIRYCTISGNTVYNCLGRGIALANAGGVKRSYSVVDSNIIDAVAYNGVYLAGTYDVVVSNNHISHCGAEGIFIKMPTAEGSTHTRCTITGNILYANNTTGISCLEWANVISNNILVNNNLGGHVGDGYSGIYLGALGGQNLVTDNYIYNTNLNEDAEANGLQRNGIYVAAGANGNILSNNFAKLAPITGRTVYDAGTDTRVLGTAFAAYGGGYRTASYDLAAINTWYNLPLTGGSLPLYQVAHDSGGANPERIAVKIKGDYQVTYSTTWLRGVGAHHAVARVVKNGTTEVPGSFMEGSQTSGDPNETHTYTKSTIVSLAADDYVTLQVGVNVAGTLINRYDDANLPDPNTGVLATLSVQLLRETY